jgi:uncharacterized membrane protein YeaQ/YmgE (transglycosylase-associated protein family)
MQGDGLDRFEAALGAISKLNLGGDDARPGAMEGARCPKCDASDFIKISDLYPESAGRLEEGGDPTAVRDGGLTDATIVARFAPPRRTSPIGIAATVGVILAAIAGYIYHRFGDTPGQIAFVVTVVITAMVLMTMARRFSDQYYYRRQRWLRTYMCRKCGQLVGS